MSLKGLTQLEIRKAKTNIFAPKGDLPPINYDRFVEAIEKHMPFFIWNEDTEGGKAEKKADLETGKPARMNFYKHRAVCYKVKDKTYYRFSVSYLEGWNKIFIINTAPAMMTIEFLEILFDIAEICEAKLYYSDTKFITEERIEKEKELALEKKAKKAN